MATFTALPVSKGDAFLLERGERTVLVDGGQYPSPLVNALGLAIPNRRLDIAVCTHADADHIGGLLGLFRSSYCPTELWLPDTWTYRLDSLITDPEGFALELARNVSAEFHPGNDQPIDREAHQAESDLGEVPRIERVAENVVRRINDLAREIQASALIEVDELENLVAGMAVYTRDPIRMFAPFYRSYMEEHPLRQRLIYSDFMVLAGKIKRIVEEAILNGVQIRWYRPMAIDAGTVGPSGGDTGFLEPMNSNEEQFVYVMNSSSLSALAYLSLTLANRNSLVFISPETDTDLAVVFSGDGLLDLLPSSKCPTRDLIITAPHHGSEANASAYTNVLAWLGSQNGPQKVIWVRSDGPSAKRPGVTFQKVAGSRFCTQCKQVNKACSAVKLTSQFQGSGNSQALTWLTQSHACVC